MNKHIVKVRQSEYNTCYNYCLTTHQQMNKTKKCWILDNKNFICLNVY